MNIYSERPKNIEIDITELEPEVVEDKDLDYKILAEWQYLTEAVAPPAIPASNNIIPDTVQALYYNDAETPAVITGNHEEVYTPETPCTPESSYPRLETYRLQTPISAVNNIEAP